jgi:UDP-N-acetylglucosamine acyltransferase
MRVHPTAVVHDGAQLGDEVSVGPFCVVGPRVRLGARTVLLSHAVIEGDTWLGEGNVVFPFACLGTRPQDKKLTGKEESCPLRIGNANEFRENVTIHGGTPHGSGTTRIGNHNMLLAGSHVGHDATIGDRVVLTNGAMIAGHTSVADRAILGAMVGLHQFARVGQGAMIGAGSMVSRDVPPFALVQGDRARLVGINAIGMRRSGASAEQIAQVKKAFRMLFWRPGTLAERLAQVRVLNGTDPLVSAVIEFVAASRRGVVSPRTRHEPAESAESSDA